MVIAETANEAALLDDGDAEKNKMKANSVTYRNSVPVPRHWCQKRKFLQGKRRKEKRPFQLPGFIAATGIREIRRAGKEEEEGKERNQEQREGTQPKMGRMDLDYQVLHDAFFKYLTKPKLTLRGDLYYEGKELEEVKSRETKQGMSSRELEEPVNREHWGYLEEEDDDVGGIAD